MAIYSFNVSSIGKNTHAVGTAGAHLAYIGREGADPILLTNNIPEDPAEARTWMDREERADRANARLGDKLRIALPRELSTEQRKALVSDFMSQIGGNRVSWFAGIHQSGDDEHNPHAHIFLRDRDVENGRRVLRLSDSARDRAKAGLEPKAVEWLRERWETVCNLALENAGVDERVDRRTLEAQGLDREATIHLGPRGQYVDQYVQRPLSKVFENAVGRKIDYPTIDQGRTRKERHEEIVDSNIERRLGAPDMATRERAKWERGQRAKDRDLERQLVAEARARTFERRRTLGRYRKQFDQLRNDETSQRHAARLAVASTYQPRILALRKRQAQERTDLKDRESTVWKRFLLAIDFTGRTRRKGEQARKALSSVHKRERFDVASAYKAGLAQAGARIAAKFTPRRDDLIARKTVELGELRSKHQTAERAADAARQKREAERAQGSQRLEIVLKLVASRGGAARTVDRGPEPGIGR